MRFVLLLVFLFGINSASSQNPDAFIITWDVNNIDQPLRLPRQPDAPNYTIDWGDGSTPDNYTSSDTPSHNYDVIGEKTITFTGNYPRLVFSGRITSVVQWGTQKWTSMERMFRNCTRLLTFPSDNVPDLSECTSMSYMFSGARNFDGDMSNWDVSNIEDMSYMFDRANFFNQDIGNWDVGSVTTMEEMFSSAIRFNQDIGDWDVGNVTGMIAMFFNARAFNQDIGDWDVSQVTNMIFTFGDASSFNQDIGDWDVSKVTNMAFMFSNASSFNQDLSKWDTSLVTSMRNMLINAGDFDQSLADWNVENVSDMAAMLIGLSIENYDATLNGWATQNLKSSVSFGAGSSQFCEGEAARQILTDTFNWNITDGGKAGNCEDLSTNEFETDITSIRVYPNPSTDYIKIAGLNSKTEYIIYNLLGAQVKRGYVSAQQNIDVTSFSNGLYILNLGDLGIKKFVKR